MGLLKMNELAYREGWRGGRILEGRLKYWKRGLETREEYRRGRLAQVEDGEYRKED